MNDSVEREKALALMARGYSPISCAHILGIRLREIDAWMRCHRFLDSLRQARSASPQIMREF